jgi:ElaB/YqjD/DUF883 family membrane-anchored ribosome-binding protein
MRWQPRAAGNGIGADELRDDFRVVMDSAEDLVKATADLGGEKVTAIRARVDQALRTAQAKMAEAQEVVVNRAKAEAEAADAYVHENPWKAMGVAAGAAAGAGLLIGLLASRR